MSDIQHFVAIDGGGTSTDVVIAAVDEHGDVSILGRASGAPGNLSSLGVDRVQAELMRCMREAWGSDALPQFRGGLIALAGAGDLHQRESLRVQLVEHGLIESLHVVTDADLVLMVAEATSGENEASVALIAGTGSIAVGCTPYADESERVGGWGPLLGDQGGGFWMGRAAVRHTLQSLESGRPLTALAKSVTDVLRAESARAVISAIHESDDAVRRLAGLAPLVLQVADKGDDAAVKIVDQAGDCLCELLAAVTRRLNVPVENTTVACCGSLLTQETRLSQRLKQHCKESGYAALYLIDDPAAAAVQVLVRDAS